ncbi:MAG TPA: 30S ribosomal protein S17e [Candidatus Nanoarchaeia archaeon]|nr:30S ribosomal protein S17e [Candidatus Nanoarchaeia archaeon]
MGRIRTTLVKRTGQKLLKINPERFTKDFEANKKAIIEAAEIPSKKLRNVIAGYITKLVKSNEK